MGTLSCINLSRFACGGDLLFSPASGMFPIVTFLWFKFCSGMVGVSDNLFEVGVYTVILESSRSTLTSWLSGLVEFGAIFIVFLTSCVRSLRWYFVRSSLTTNFLYGVQSRICDRRVINRRAILDSLNCNKMGQSYLDLFF